MTLMMTSAQVVETSVNVTNNSPSRDYSHPDDQTTQTIVIFVVVVISIKDGFSHTTQVACIEDKMLEVVEQVSEAKFSLACL